MGQGGHKNTGHVHDCEWARTPRMPPHPALHMAACNCTGTKRWACLVDDGCHVQGEREGKLVRHLDAVHALQGGRRGKGGWVQLAPHCMNGASLVLRPASPLTVPLALAQRSWAARPKAACVAPRAAAPGCLTWKSNTKRCSEKHRTGGSWRSSSWRVAVTCGHAAGGSCSSADQCKAPGLPSAAPDSVL